MKNPVSLAPLAAAVAVQAFAAVTPSCAHAAAPMVPPSLAPAAHETLRLGVSARGVQVYECRRTADGAAWTFVAPVADLYDADGRHVGTHGAGPHWRFSDGSHVSGRLRARADAPQPDAIPWLLLDAHARWPHDRLAVLSSIQRVNTRGGLPPAANCDPARVGHAVRVPYSADYLFYGRR